MTQETRKAKIEAQLRAAFHPDELEIVDESYQHQGHAGVAADSQETHFRIRIVSESFRGLSGVETHRVVYRALQPFFESGLHALSLTASPP